VCGGDAAFLLHYFDHLSLFELDNEFMQSHEKQNTNDSWMPS